MSRHTPPAAAIDTFKNKSLSVIVGSITRSIESLLQELSPLIVGSIRPCFGDIIRALAQMASCRKQLNEYVLLRRSLLGEVNSTAISLIREHRVARDIRHRLYAVLAHSSKERSDLEESLEDIIFGLEAIGKTKLAAQESANCEIRALVRELASLCGIEAPINGLIMEHVDDVVSVVRELLHPSTDLGAAASNDLLVDRKDTTAAGGLRLRYVELLDARAALVSSIIELNDSVVRATQQEGRLSHGAEEYAELSTADTQIGILTDSLTRTECTHCVNHGTQGFQEFLRDHIADPSPVLMLSNPNHRSFHAKYLEFCTQLLELWHSKRLAGELCIYKPEILQSIEAVVQEALQKVPPGSVIGPEVVACIQSSVTSLSNSHSDSTVRSCCQVCAAALKDTAVLNSIHTKQVSAAEYFVGVMDSHREMLADTFSRSFARICARLSDLHASYNKYILGSSDLAPISPRTIVQSFLDSASLLESASRTQELYVKALSSKGLRIFYQPEVEHALWLARRRLDDFKRKSGKHLMNEINAGKRQLEGFNAARSTLLAQLATLGGEIDKLWNEYIQSCSARFNVKLSCESPLHSELIFASTNEADPTAQTKVQVRLTEILDRVESLRCTPEAAHAPGELLTVSALHAIPQAAKLIDSSPTVLENSLDSYDSVLTQLQEKDAKLAHISRAIETVDHCLNSVLSTIDSCDLCPPAGQANASTCSRDPTCPCAVAKGASPHCISFLLKQKLEEENIFACSSCPANFDNIAPLAADCLETLKPELCSALECDACLIDASAVSAKCKRVEGLADCLADALAQLLAVNTSIYDISNTNKGASAHIRETVDKMLGASEAAVAETVDAIEDVTESFARHISSLLHGITGEALGDTCFAEELFRRRAVASALLKKTYSPQCSINLRGILLSALDDVSGTGLLEYTPDQVLEDFEAVLQRVSPLCSHEADGRLAATLCPGTMTLELSGCTRQGVLLCRGDQLLRAFVDDLSLESIASFASAASSLSGPRVWRQLHTKSHRYTDSREGTFSGAHLSRYSSALRNGNAQPPASKSLSSSMLRVVSSALAPAARKVPVPVSVAVTASLLLRSSLREMALEDAVTSASASASVAGSAFTASVAGPTTGSQPLPLAVTPATVSQWKAHFLLDPTRVVVPRTISAPDARVLGMLSYLFCTLTQTLPVSASDVPGRPATPRTVRLSADLLRLTLRHGHAGVSVFPVPSLTLTTSSSPRHLCLPRDRGLTLHFANRAPVSLAFPDAVTRHVYDTGLQTLIRFQGQLPRLSVLAAVQ